MAPQPRKGARGAGGSGWPGGPALHPTLGRARSPSEPPADDMSGRGWFLTLSWEDRGDGGFSLDQYEMAGGLQHEQAMQVDLKNLISNMGGLRITWQPYEKASQAHSDWGSLRGQEVRACPSSPG